MMHTLANAVLAAGSHGASATNSGQGVYNYWLVIILMMTGLYLVLSRANMVKTVIGLNLFQAGAILFYVCMGKIDGGTAPIIAAKDTVYSNPLPHVLMLTAIVVGVATTALALALVVRVNEAYGTIEENELDQKDQLAAEAAS